MTLTGWRTEALVCEAALKMRVPETHSSELGKRAIKSGGIFLIGIFCMLADRGENVAPDRREIF